ncbi:MAG: carbohydrate-binding protein [Bacteroidota bacterium]
MNKFLRNFFCLIVTACILSFNVSATNNDHLPPFTTIQAESYNSMSGIQSETCTDTGGGTDIGNTDTDDYLVFNNVDITGAQSLDMRIASDAGFIGTAEFRLGSTSGTLIATVPFGNTGGWQSWITRTVTVSGASGIQNLYIVFKGGISIGNVNWFKFNTDPVPAPSAPTSLTAVGIDGQINLTWAVSSAATTYTVKRAAVSGGPYSIIQAGIVGTTYANTSLTNGTTYYYVVTATNTSGESSNSNQASAMPHVVIKVSCIGNSITAGAGVSNVATKAYPAQLGTLLGAGYTSSNFGHSGATLMKNGDLPYWTVVEYTNALASNPNIVVIKLGTNDSKSWNWSAHGSEFQSDYKAMVDAFRSLPSNPKVFVCLNSKAFSSAYAIDETTLANSIRPAILQVAKAKGISVIDVYDATISASANFPDGVHPNDAGALIIATKVKNLITYVVPPITKTGDVLTAPSANAYQWYLNGDTIAAVNGGTNQNYTAAIGGSYSVQLKLNSTNNDRVMTDAYTVTVSGTLPTVPNGLIASAGNATVTLNWNASIGATSYTIKRAAVSGGPYSTIQSGTTNTAFTNTGLTNGVTYYYVVSAVNLNGETVNSTQASATPLSSFALEPDNAYYLNGNDGVQVLVANPHADGQPGAFDAIGTMEGWFRPNWIAGTHTVDPTLFSMVDWWGVRWNLVMGKDYSSIGFMGATNSYLPYNFKKGLWYHIAAVINAAGNATVYVNGVSIGTSVSVLNNGITGTPFKIGISWSWATNEQFEGGIDEVRVWKTRRTANEIASNFLGVISPSNTDLLAYYKFNQSSGTSLPDLTSNANNGSMIYWNNNAATPTSAPTWVESYALAIPTAVTPTNLLNTSFTAEWTAPVYGSVNNYLLDVSTDRNFGTYVAGYNRLDVGNVTSYNVTGLPTGVIYYYRVSANKVSVANQGGLSNIDSTFFPLPVRLVYFTVQKKNDEILLQWQTSAEFNNSFFNVQHSINGTDWINVGMVQAGNSNSIYSFSHNATPGIQYYRLQQFDKNGQVMYSTIRVINTNADSKKLLVYPNPVETYLTINLNRSIVKPLEYSVINSEGKIVKKGNIMYSQYDINISHLSKGFYILKIINERPLQFIKK